MALESLPFEVLEIVFSHLGVLDRLAASSVCKQWYYASLNLNVWRDVVVCINIEKAPEGLNVLTSSERPFPCVLFKDCCKDACKDFSDVFPDCHTLFLHALEMCKVVGQRLTSLQFNNCSISGSHFTQILVECPNLKHLSAINCESLFDSEEYLSEPEEIHRLKLTLKNVKEVDLSFNKCLSDMFFVRLSQTFTSVESLSIANCPINFQEVVFKRFYRNHDNMPWSNIFTFSWIKEFIANNARRIISVNFSGTEIDDTALKALAKMEGLQLENISISCCQRITARGLKELCLHQKNLKKLDVPVSIELSEVLPAICNNLLELRELCVGSYWPAERVSSLLALKTHTLNKLVKLKLDSCSEIVVLKFIDSLRNEAYPRLRHISLGRGMVDDYVFIYTIPYLLHITYLDLGGSQITDKSIIMVSTHLVHLKVLLLSQCDCITDNGLTGRSETCPLLFNYYPQGDVLMGNPVPPGFGNRNFLKWLAFDEDHPVSVSNLKGLRELNLYGIRGISDDGIKVALKFSELKCLYIGGSSKITDEGLLFVGKNNRSIEVLSLRNSDDVTENGIAKVLSYLPRLKLLDLEGCKKLTQSTISYLVKEHSFKLKYLL